MSTDFSSTQDNRIDTGDVEWSDRPVTERVARRLVAPVEDSAYRVWIRIQNRLNNRSLVYNDGEIYTNHEFSDARRVGRYESAFFLTPGVLLFLSSALALLYTLVGQTSGISPLATAVTAWVGYLTMAAGLLWILGAEAPDIVYRSSSVDGDGHVEVHERRYTDE